MRALYSLFINPLPANYFFSNKLMLTAFDVTLVNATLRLLQLAAALLVLAFACAIVAVLACILYSGIRQVQLTILSLHDKQESGFADSESASPASLRSSVLKLKDESGARQNPSARPAYKILSKSAAHQTN